MVSTAILTSCGSSNSSNQSPNPTVLKGDRLMGLHITTASDNDFNAAYAVAEESSMDFVNVHFIWGDGGRSDIPLTPLEGTGSGTTPGTYHLSNSDAIGITRDFYGIVKNKPVVMTIGTIDTNNKFVPSDLSATAFNSSTMKTRFRALIDAIFAITNFDQLSLVTLIIGNEIDATLGTDATAWAQYKDFFDDVSAYARTKRSGLKVGFTMTHKAILDSTKFALAQNLLSTADIISLTYYPYDPSTFVMNNVSTVETDFDSIVSTLGGSLASKKIYFQEVGYSSGSSYVGSSLTKQADFIHEVFSAWDTHRDRVQAVSFLNTTEWSQTSVNNFGLQYNLCSSVFDTSTLCLSFKEYLKTLGLRYYDSGGAAKPAWTKLIEEATARGW